MENKKVALVLLPLFWPKMPPLGLASLKGHLESSGIPAKCYDLNNFFYNRAPLPMKTEWHKSCNKPLEAAIFDIIKNEHSAEIERIINELSGYGVVGFSCYKSNMKTVTGFSELLRRKTPEVKIVLGGPEMARCYFDLGEKALDGVSQVADHIVVGEGEKPLEDIINGRGKRIVLYEEMKDLSCAASPEFSDLVPGDYPGKDAVPLLFSRGCVRKCSFCAEKLLYKGFRMYPAEIVVRQIRQYASKGIFRFVFHDSLINGDIEELERLCDAIIAETPRVKWEAQIAIRPEMTDSMLAKMKKAGCYHLFVGLESGSDPVLRRMNKGFSTDEAVGFFRKLAIHGLSFGVSVITGLPGETEEEFLEGLEFIVRNKGIIPRIEQVNPFVYYDGIALPKEADYKTQEESITRARRFIEKIDAEGFKYTKAFMLNLVEPEWK